MTTDSHKSAMSAATDRRSDPPRGFTLVELIITIALIAILAALAVPSLQNVTRQGEGRSTAREMANHFRMARDQAMSRGEVVFAKLDQDGGTGNQGSIELRATNSAATNCRIAVPDNTRLVRTMEVREFSGELEIRGATHDAPTDYGDSGEAWICFSPTGEVLNANGNEFDADSGSNVCERGTFRVWIAEENPADTSSNEISCDPSDETAQANARYLINFWLVEVPYNGGIRVVQ